MNKIKQSQFVPASIPSEELEKYQFSDEEKNRILEAMAEMSPVCLRMMETLSQPEPQHKDGEMGVYYVVLAGAIQLFATGTSENNVIRRVIKFVRKHNYDPNNVLSTSINPYARLVNITLDEYTSDNLGYRPVVGTKEIKWESEEK